MSMPHIKESHRGLLHKKLGKKPGEKIGVGELMRTEKRAKRTGNVKLEREAVFAENARHWNHK